MGPLTTTRPCEGAMLSSVPVAACGPFCLSQACVARPLLCPLGHWAIGLRVAFAVRVSRASPLPPAQSLLLIGAGRGENTANTGSIPSQSERLVSSSPHLVGDVGQPQAHRW